MADVATTRDPAKTRAPRQGRRGSSRRPWRGDPAKTRAPRQGRRDEPREPGEFEEVVINIDRVARVVKGGRRFRFKALVVVGNRKDKVGVGVSKGQDVPTA